MKINSNDGKKALKLGLFLAITVVALNTPDIKFWLRFLLLLSATGVFINMSFFVNSKFVKKYFQELKSLEISEAS